MPAPRAGAADAGPAVTRSRELARTLAELDGRIEGHRNRAHERADNWLDLEHVATLYLQRARLTGDYDDYARAEDALDLAFRRAPEGSGPVLTRANFNYTVHRLPRIGEDLARLERFAIPPPEQREAVASLRADIAYHSGRYDEARRGYDALLAGRRTMARLVALAQLDWKTNHFDRATALLDEAEGLAAREAVETRAWLALVRGLLEVDRGRWDDALARFRDALRLRPGSWAIEEHIAEVLGWQGHHEESRLMYADLVARTGDPEFMGQLAELEARRGARARADELLAQARAVYGRRAARFPEATAGHAIEFFLAHDPPRALALAVIDRAARPGGEAQVRYARALLRNGRFAEAREVLVTTLATVWNTADLHAAAAVAFASLGDRERASAELRAARAIDPHAGDDLDEMLPPGADAGLSALR